MEASTTQQLGYGYYSPYVASVLDIARIFDTFRTAEYQYIPALASEQDDKLALTLNTPPSFNSPKSVLVAALPAVEQAQPPPLHAVDPKEVYCASRTSMVLPVEGAPLVFSTAYAHDLVLSLSTGDGKTVELPARADAAQGGYVVDTAPLRSATLADSVHALLQGYWGFDAYAGPGFQLRNAHAGNWALADGDEDALIVGRQDTVHLRADSAGCVDGIMIKDPSGKDLKAEWKELAPDEVEVKLPLQQAQPGAMALLVKQYGVEQPQAIPVQGYADAARLDGFVIHAGDAQGVLRGGRLDEVASLGIGSINFLPGELKSERGSDQLPMVAQDAAAAAALKSDAVISAKVTLKDGRVYRLTGSVDAPRPSVLLIGKSEQPSRANADSRIQLVNQDELPPDALLTFSVRAQSPASFSHDETIEVATADQSFTTALSLANGGMRLEDAKVAVVALDPARAFGPSAFGPLQFRLVTDGVAGDWQPLATLVRLPALKDLQCPAAPDLACKLTGTDLFLVDSVSGDPQFEHPVQVPDGFPGYAMPVPHPKDGRLYLKLRDDPSVVNTAALDVQQLPPAPDEVAHAPPPAADTAHPGHDTVFTPGANAPAANAPAPNPPAPDSRHAPATQSSQSGEPAPVGQSAVPADAANSPTGAHSN
jgi:hypothetical protein